MKYYFSLDLSRFIAVKASLSPVFRPSGNHPWTFLDQFWNCFMLLYAWCPLITIFVILWLCIISLHPLFLFHCVFCLFVPFKKRPKTMIPIVCQQNNSHTIKPSPPARKLDTRQDGSIHSGCLCQTLILPSKYHRRNQDSSDQATFSVVYCPILLNIANCGFSFLFLANWTLLIIYLH